MRQRNAKRSFRRQLNQVIIPANQYIIEPWYAQVDPIWLVGDGRSGTTWVSSILNYHNRYRYLFEPFHPAFVEATSPFRAFQYLRPRDVELLPVAKYVFSGRIRHSRVDRYTPGLLFRGLLIKDIFAHLFLNWVDIHLPAVRKILLMRHPFAVALSKLERQNWWWVRNPAHLLDQTALREDFLEPHVGLISTIKDAFERHVLIWAIIHSVPLRQLVANRLLIVFYEELFVEPEAQIQRMLEFVGDPRAGKPLNHRLQVIVERASQTSDNAGSRNRRRVDDWRSRLSARQIASGVAILREFGLDVVYGDDPMPASRTAAQLSER